MVCLVAGSAGSGKTTILQRVREAAREGAVGKPYGFHGLWRRGGEEREVAAEGVLGGEEGEGEEESEHRGTHEVVTFFRCKSGAEERSEEEGELGEEEEELGERVEAEAKVLLHEVSTGSGSPDSVGSDASCSALAHTAEVRRMKDFARCAMVAFDVTSLSSYLTAKELCKTLRGDGDDETDCIITLLGNKNFSPSAEREYTRAVATLSAMDFAEENKCLYFEVGALGGQNVLEAVSETLRLAMEPLLPHGGLGKGNQPKFLSRERLNRLNIVANSLVPTS
ncbi:hypothetical protein HOP50_04g29370 [Chloropicon primus]|nr:hypothetical protein HOP50_04g29370 [Chloropicon primus]